MLEYNLVGVPTKLIILRYFWESLKPSVLAKLEYQDLELESFNQIIKKTISSKGKLALWSCSRTKKIDQNCPRGNKLANSTIAKSQSSSVKDPRVEKPKVQGKKSSSSH